MFFTTKLSKAVKRGGADGFSYESCAENDLIEKARNGSSEAFQNLMSSHLKVIYNYICAHVNVSEDTKDIVQEAMLSVWNGLKGFDNRSSFRTWVLGITRRKIADHYRRFYKNPAVSLSDFEESITSEDEYDSINDKVIIENAMNVLDILEREIVFLAFNAQLRYTEISEITGIPVGTIKSKMSCIKAKLRKRLENGG